MFKHVFCCFALIAGSTQAFSQTYTPFPDSNAVWRMEEWHHDGAGNYDYSYYTYFLNGRTTINSTSYSNVWEIFQGDTSYLGTIREDSLKRVFFNGTILYQFGLNVGDSIFYPGGRAYVVLEVNNGGYVMEGNNSVFGPDYWIEGIGSLKGLFFPYKNEFENGYHLTCFLPDREVVFPDTTCLTTAISNSNPGDDELQIYPNPSFGTIQFSFAGLQKLRFALFDVLGHQVLLKPLETNSHQTINIDHIPSGMYIYHLASDDQIIKTGKLIIDK